MSSKNEILSRLRANLRETYDMPSMNFEKRVFEDPVEEFKRQLTSTAGAAWIEMSTGDDINEKVLQAYPDAGKICGNWPGLKADVDPDAEQEATGLDGCDVGLVEGGVACAENACVWVPMNMRQKAVCFIVERLVIIVHKSQIVSNMHQAYEVLDKMGETSRYGFGTFISGPSKTADIEQCLVYGAQAARSVTVLLTD